MVLVTKNWADNFCYRTSFVESAIDIVHWDRLGELDEVEVGSLGIVSVNELPSCSTVYKGRDRFLLCHVCSFNLDLQLQ